MKGAQQSLDLMAYKKASDYLERAAAKNPKKQGVKVLLAYSYFKLGEYENSVGFLEKELSRYPESLEANILLGYVHFTHKELRKAEEAFLKCNTIIDNLETKKNQKKLVKSIPNLGLPNFILGHYLKNEKKPLAAKKSFQLAFERGYDAVQVQLQLADVEFTNKNWEAGLKSLLEAKTAYGEHPEINFLMGYAFHQTGDTDKALISFEKAVKKMPYSAEALKNLAKLFFSKNDHERSAPLFQQLLILVPYDYEAKFLLEEALKGNAALTEKKHPQLTKEWVENIRPTYKYVFKTNFNQAAKSINSQALLLVREGRFVEASTLLRRFIELKDRSPTLSYNLAKLYNIQNRLKEALEFSWKVVEKQPDFKDAYDLVGNIFFKIHDFQNSLLFYSKVVELDPKDAMGYYNLGHVYHTTGNLQKAKENFIKAIQNEKKMLGQEEEDLSEEKLNVSLIVETRPVAFEAHKSLGFLYIKQQEMALALEEFKQAIELEPSDPAPYYEIGKIYIGLKDVRQAHIYLDKYIYLGGSEEKVKKILKN